MGKLVVKLNMFLHDRNAVMLGSKIKLQCLSATVTAVTVTHYSYSDSDSTVVVTERPCTLWGGRLREMFCYMFSESSTGSRAELQLPCCPSKQRELPEKMLQNLLLNLPPQTVQISKFTFDQS